MQRSETANQCDMSNLITKKRYDTHDMSGRFISQVNLTPALEATWQNIFNGEKKGMMVLLSVENETVVGGMLLIPKSCGSNG